MTHIVGETDYEVGVSSKSATLLGRFPKQLSVAHFGDTEESLKGYIVYWECFLKILEISYDYS